MAITSVKASENWVRPSDFMKDVTKYVNTADGAQDTLDSIINCFDWMAYLGINPKFAEHSSKTLEPINQTLSFPQFLGTLGTLNNKIQRFSNTDDSDVTKDIWDNAMLTGVHGAKSCMALDSWGVYGFKEGMKTIKTVFWSCLVGLDALGMYYEIGEAELLQKTIDCTNDPKLRSIYEHKLQNTKLKVLKNAVIAVAMAPLCLISILFASMAKGLLFHPAVFLSLTSAWCVLNFVTYFYEKAIDRWEKDYHMLKA